MKKGVNHMIIKIITTIGIQILKPILYEVFLFSREGEWSNLLSVFNPENAEGTAAKKNK